MSHTYREGQLVWAKMRGHPHWPAKVARSPKGQARPQGKLWIFFYGTHQHAWLPAADLCSYQEHRERFSQPKKVKGFAEAIWEIEEDPDLVITLGKPPSKKRRRSTVRGQPQDGSGVEQTSSVVAEECTPPPKPLPSPSSNEPQPAGRPRYVTRQQKRSSEGIVAQITQNFAARMELKPKSPRLKFSVASEEKSSVQSCEDEGNCATSQDKQRDVESSELVTPPKRQRRKTRSSIRLSTSNSCKPTLLSAVKLEEEEAKMECVAEGIVDGNTTFGAGGEVAAEEKREEGEGEGVVKMGAENIETENVAEIEEMETEKSLEENATETEKVGEAAKEREMEEEEVGEAAKEREMEEEKVGEAAKEREMEEEKVGVAAKEREMEEKVGEGAKEREMEEEKVGEAAKEREMEEEKVGEGAKEREMEEEKVGEAAKEEEKVPNTAKENKIVAETAKEEKVAETAKENEKIVKEDGPEMEVAEKEREGENVETEKEKRIEISHSPVSTSVSAGRSVGACEGDGGHLATGNSSQQTSSDVPPGCKGIPTNKENKVDLPRFSVHKDMPLTEVLTVLNYNLKASLALQALDVPAAIATLHQLQNVQVTAKDLQLVPDVVATLRKVRRFSGDAGVRGLAEEVYSSLKAMFQGQENESTPSKEGVRRKMMVARGGIGGKAPSRRTAGKRATSSKPVVHEDHPLQGRSDDQTVPSVQSEL